MARQVGFRESGSPSLVGQHERTDIAVLSREDFT